MKVVSYDCIDRHHLIAGCNSCAMGTLMTTCRDDFNGVTETNCTECNFQHEPKLLPQLSLLRKIEKNGDFYFSREHHASSKRGYLE